MKQNICHFFWKIIHDSSIFIVSSISMEKGPLRTYTYCLKSKLIKAKKSTRQFTMGVPCQCRSLSSTHYINQCKNSYLNQIVLINNIIIRHVTYINPQIVSIDYVTNIGYLEICFLILRDAEVWLIPRNFPTPTLVLKREYANLTICFSTLSFACANVSFSSKTKNGGPFSL